MGFEVLCLTSKATGTGKAEAEQRNSSGVAGLQKLVATDPHTWYKFLRSKQ